MTKRNLSAMNRSTAAKSVGTIDRLLDELANLAADPDTSTNQFCNRTVQVAESLLDLEWAAVVACTSESPEAGSPEAGSPEAGSPEADSPRTDTNLAPVLVAGGDLAAEQLAKLNQPFPKLTGHSSSIWLDALERSPHVCCASVFSNNQTWGWLIAANKNKATVKGFEAEVLAGIGEIVTDHLKSKSEQSGQTQVQFQNRLDAFKLNSHASLDLQRSSKQIANDVRWLCGCERATLLSVNDANSRSRVLAVSSIATVDRNSDFAKQLQQLTSLAVKSGLLVTTDPIAGQHQNVKLKTLVDQWSQTSGFEFLFGIPLVDRVDGRTTGFLVLEADKTIDRASFATALRQVQPHVAVAISNAQRYESIPFRGSLAALKHVVGFSSLFKLAVLMAAIAVVIAAMVLIQRPFSVRARGELLPRIEQTVSAKIEGNVATVDIEHGQRVIAGQCLATINSPDLISEIESVEGEHAKTQQLIDSKKILMGQYGHAGDPSLIGRLAAEISDLQFQLELLQNRQTFLNEKRRQLEIVAPRSGQVITWRPQANLLGKPVQWGDRLFDIADLDGDWEVVLRVPEQRIGYVWDQVGIDSELASNKLDRELSVEFFLQSNPDRRYQSSVIEIARSVELDPELGALTTIRCRVPEELRHCRHGASVVADIDCGNRSLAFVCFGEFWDGLRRNWVRSSSKRPAC